MEFNKNEFTIQSLIEYLNAKFDSKISGKEFNHSDIAQYCIRGYLPYRYGGNKLEINKSNGIKTIKILDFKAHESAEA